VIDVELVLTADGTLTIDGATTAAGTGDPVTVGLDHITAQARALGRPLLVRAVDETGQVTVLTVHPDGRADQIYTPDTPDIAAAATPGGPGPVAVTAPQPPHNGHAHPAVTTTAADRPGIAPDRPVTDPSPTPGAQPEQTRPERTGPPPPAIQYRPVPRRAADVPLRLVDIGHTAPAPPPESPAPPTPAASAERDSGPAGPLSTGLLVHHHVPRELRPARWGWRSWLRVPPGPAEQLHRARVSTVRRPLTGPRTVVVVNPKGGAGKTPAALLLAATLGAHRGSALAWDNNETRGTLGLRALAHPDTNRTVWDLLADVDHFQTMKARIGDLAAYTRPQGEARFDVLASDGDPARMAQVDAGEFRRIREVLARFYGVIVIDTGNNVRASNWQAAVDAADALVLVSSYQADTAETAGWVLDHLRSTGRGRLADHAVTVLTAARPAVDPAVRRELVAHYSGVTRAVVEIPYDPVIATGQTLDLYALHRRTREAWLAAAAAVVDGLTGPPHPLRDT